MDVYDIHKKTGIKLRTLKKLEDLGLLKADPEREGFAEYRKIKENLRAGRRLSAKQCLLLIKNSEWPGLDLYTVQVNRHIDALGDVEGEALPKDNGPHVWGAARREPDSMAILAAWIIGLTNTSRGFMLGMEQSHAYIVTRMLFNHTEQALETDLPLANGAMLRLRQSGLLNGYFTKHESGVISYHKKKEFDL